MNVANNHNLKNSLLNVSFYQETTKSILLKPPLRQIVSFSHIKKKNIVAQNTQFNKYTKPPSGHPHLQLGFICTIHFECIQHALISTFTCIHP